MNDTIAAILALVATGGVVLLVRLLPTSTCTGECRQGRDCNCKEEK